MYNAKPAHIKILRDKQNVLHVQQTQSQMPNPTNYPIANAHQDSKAMTAIPALNALSTCTKPIQELCAKIAQHHPHPQHKAQPSQRVNVIKATQEVSLTRPALALNALLEHIKIQSEVTRAQTAKVA